MLKAVRVLARQQMPNYRKPSSFLIKESYPLPPYSSVIGLVHKLCGFDSYQPMQVSVQGCYASITSDYATNYAFGAVPLERAQLCVNCEEGKKVGVARMPRSYELLTDVALLLHIIPEEEWLVSEILAAFTAPPIYPSLGRHEDLLQIEEASIVELSSAPETVTTKFDAYVPSSSLDPFYSKSIVGTIYRLGKLFEYDNGKSRGPTSSPKSKRVWKETVSAYHICSNVVLRGYDGILYDNLYHDVVFPA